MSRKLAYLGDVEVFLAVVEHGSFTAGAVALSTTPSVLTCRPPMAITGCHPCWRAVRSST